MRDYLLFEQIWLDKGFIDLVPLLIIKARTNETAIRTAKFKGYHAPIIQERNSYESAQMAAKADAAGQAPRRPAGSAEKSVGGRGSPRERSLSQGASRG